jgi:rhodanese-related sulfurtransferase
VRRTLREAILVAVVGALVALAANALSPRGLKLSRNYFPPAPVAGPGAPATTNSLSASNTLVHPGTNAPASTAAIIERLRSKGLEHLATTEAAALFRDPGYQVGTILFVDARDDALYEAGHIPGAYQLDYYRPEQDLPIVLPLTQVAQRIVIYCSGGDCEDSEFTALLLRNAGVTPEKIRVYLGGFTEWRTNNLPVELGQRMSGNIINAN